MLDGSSSFSPVLVEIETLRDGGALVSTSVDLSMFSILPSISAVTSILCSTSSSLTAFGDGNFPIWLLLSKSILIVVWTRPVPKVGNAFFLQQHMHS